MTSLQLIQNWFIGNERDNIPPLHALDSKMVLHLKLNKYCNSMKCFMGVVQKYAEGTDLWIKDPCGWDIKSVNKMWEAIKPEFTRRFCQTNRKKELTWKTAYNNMSKSHAFGNERNCLATVLK